jgi:hypothetical protein
MRYHYKIFKEWQKKNQIVKLRINDDQIINKDLKPVSLTLSLINRSPSERNNLTLNNQDEIEFRLLNSTNSRNTREEHEANNRNIINAINL